MQTLEAAAPPLPHRIAFISIIAFWTLYFAVLTFRALAIYHYHYGMAARTIVSVAGIGITILFYLILRRIPTTRMGLGITVAALLAAPCACVYSTVNYYAFRQSAMEEESKSWSKKAATPGTAITQPAMTVGAMKSHDEMSMLGEIADQAANGYFFFASWASLYLALCYAARLGAVERRAAQLQAAAQSAELRALRYQVNPHFLFNTLNSLSSLVLTGKRDEAERMILNLATFFRTSLTGDPTEDVPLGDEIQLQRLYLDIETVRFPERLTVVIDLPEALRSACVPGLILQPLVENAVKYGVSRTRRPVTIRIRAREEQGNLQLTVEDDGDPMENDAVQGTGVGLRNVRDRLAARYGADAHSLWGRRPEGGFSVTLQIPLVRDGC
ncbi:sensor histidine kinase [Sphingomonas sp. MMS24-J13]|uniref:sensor histidine kinase n=1 Tax=Sphingomonas sp. MMS24-J13 TaxID=3238686 RepID=UPI00384F5F7F